MKLKTLFCLILITLAAVLSLTAHAQIFSVIHNFTGKGEGSFPLAGLTLRGGKLYGTTEEGGIGGINGYGTVFEMTPSGDSSWSTFPRFFLNGSDGSYPEARAIFGPDGHLYTTTIQGGSFGLGSVIELTPGAEPCRAAKCFWTEKVIYEFQSGADGAFASGDLLFDQQGNIYGTTSSGGLFGYGTVYELARSGDTWTKTILYNFAGQPDGFGPLGGVIFDGNGNLYGTTARGGSTDYGTVFELSYSPGAGWTETILYNLSFANGGLPWGGVIFDQSGNLFGTTSGYGPEDGGTVFELTRSGNGWNYQFLAIFAGRVECGPLTSLTMDAAGSLYGTTQCDGANQLGNVFKLTKTDNGWTYTSLHDFSGFDGSDINSNVTIDSGGNLYGTAWMGGPPPYGGPGTVWMIKP